MKVYEFLERVHVYYSIEAESEDEAWEKMRDIDCPLSKDPQVSYDAIECVLNNVEDIENAN